MAGNSMKAAGLTSIDRLDGLGAGEDPVEPRWVEHEWPFNGLRRVLLGHGERKAAYRLDSGGYKPGWWELNDLIAVICGHEYSLVGGTTWHVLDAVDLIKVMAAFRMLGADDRLEICLPPSYREITVAHPQNIDEQIKAAVQLSRTGAEPEAPA